MADSSSEMRNADVLLPIWEIALPVPADHDPLPEKWAPNADHYPKLKMDGGHFDPWNVRLAHVECNAVDIAWRGRIHRRLKDKPTMSFQEIAEALNDERVQATARNEHLDGCDRPQGIRHLGRSRKPEPEVPGRSPRC